MTSLDNALGLGLTPVELKPPSVRWVDVARRWPIVATVTTLAILGSAAWLYVARPIYQSASVLVTSPSDGTHVRSIEASNPLSEMLDKNYDLSIETHLSLLKEGDLQTYVAKKVGGVVDTNKGDAADTVPIIVNGGKYKVKFENPTDTELIQVTAQGPDARTAAMIAQTYSTSYVKQVHDMQIKDFRDAEARAKASMLQATAQLETNEKALERLRSQHDLTDIDQTLQGQMADYTALKTKRDTVAADLSAAKHQAEVARQQLNSLPAVNSTVLDVNGDQSVALLMQQLRQKQIDRLALLKTYRPTTNIIKNADAQIAMLQNQIDQAKKEAKTRNERENPSWVAARQNLFQLQVAQRGLESQMTQIQQALNQSQARLHQFPEWQLQYGVAQRQVDLSKDGVVSLRKVLDDLALRQQTRPDLIRVVQAADVPTDPVAPNKTLTLALGGILGLMMGLFVAAGTAARNRYFLNAYDASNSLGLRLLGRAPVLPSGGGAAVLDEFGMEALRSVGANLRILCDSYDARTIVLAPVVHDRRADWIAASLANLTAAAEGRAVLIDTNAAEPWLTTHYGLIDKPGLSDVLLGHVPFEEVAYPVGPSGLEVVPIGTQRSALSDLLGSSAMGKLMGHLRERDVITILSTSGRFGEMAVPAAFADAMVMVVDPTVDDRELISTTLNAFTAANARVVGMVDSSGLPTKVLPEVAAPRYSVMRAPSAIGSTTLLPNRSEENV